MEERINYQKIININGEGEFTHYYEIDNQSCVGKYPPDMIDEMNEILEIMKKNNILIVKVTRFDIKNIKE